MEKMTKVSGRIVIVDIDGTVDRDSVVAKWRSLGLRCLQVAPGDF